MIVTIIKKANFWSVCENYTGSGMRIIVICISLICISLIYIIVPRLFPICALDL